MGIAKTIRVLALAGFLAIMAFAWFSRDTDRLSREGEAEALRSGFASASFGKERENGRAKYVCGVADGAPAIFREPGGLIVGEDDFTRRAVASWCG